MKTLYKMIDNELAQHPACLLVDIYKLYMQSACGPGHLIPDIDIARKYLINELSEKRTYLSVGAVVNHPLSVGTPFMASKPHNNTHPTHPCIILDCDAIFPLARYSLQVVNDSIVPLDIYFEAFIETANTCEKLDYETFCRYWQEIITYLTEIGFKYSTEELMQIEQVMYNLVSHSQIYNQLYQPSYRVINKNYLAEYFPTLYSNSI